MPASPALAVLQEPALPPAPPAPPLPPAVAPTPPAEVVVGEVVTVQPGAAGAVPQTVEQVQGLRELRSVLLDQLQRAQNRRERLVGDLEDASGASRVGLEQRLQQLDARILQLEQEMAGAEQRLTSAPAELLATAQEPSFQNPSNVPEEVFVLGGLTIVFVLFPLAVAAARLMWRRAKAPPVPKESRESAERMARLEQAVDTIAVEVERVSEGQRFMTRLLTEGNGGLGALNGARREGELAPLARGERLATERGGTS